MWCPECNICGGCYCHDPPKVKYRPRDHEKELEKWLAEMYSDARSEIKINENER